MKDIPRSNKRFIDHVEEQDRKKGKKLLILLVIITFVIALVIVFWLAHVRKKNNNSFKEVNSEEYVSDNDNYLEMLPQYTGSPYSVINNNIPWFNLDRIDTSKSFEKYSELDDLGRCGAAYANLGRDLMPTENRGEIGMIKPSGWHTVKYPGIIDDLYLYNRCHLIAYSLSGENANELNLITGTRYFNISGMLPFENITRNYIEETNNHVLYRVTPVYDGKDLVARGVLMEGLSVEDSGSGIRFNVFVYNVQPGIIIDYLDGTSKAE